MKKRILVPVDFSKSSKTAYWYARYLADIYDLDLEVLHAYHSSMFVEEPIVVVPGKTREEVMEANLEDFIKDIPEESGSVLTRLKVTPRLVEGGPVQVVLNESNKEDCFLIVMGNRGRHGAAEKLFGSVSSVVAQSAGCPVLLIPKGTVVKPIENILYASSLESAYPEVLNQITQFADTFRAVLHFIHVKTAKENIDFTETEERIFEQLFDKGEPDFAFNMASISADNILEGLNQYASENQIDLVVLANKHRSFFETVMGYSLTQKMASQLKYPLMVYHLPFKF